MLESFCGGLWFERLGTILFYHYGNVVAFPPYDKLPKIEY